MLCPRFLLTPLTGLLAATAGAIAAAPSTPAASPAPAAAASAAIPKLTPAPVASPAPATPTPPPAQPKPASAPAKPKPAPSQPAAAQPKPTPAMPSKAASQEMRRLEVAGVRLGDSKRILAKFPQAKKVPWGPTDREVYEISRPNPQISLLVLTFRSGRVVKMELRYFNGPGERSLRNAGEWNGLRDYMVERFGPPTRSGKDVPLLTDLRQLNPAYAKFNGEWDFPRLKRRAHYITLSDAKGGIGVVTFADTTPSAAAIPPARTTGAPLRPDPGF